MKHNTHYRTQIMIYESGFFWKVRPDLSATDLLAPTLLVAATVFLKKDLSGHNWHIWDEDGVGGENSSERTVERAKIAAESAVLRWGRHFYTDRRNLKMLESVES